MSNRLNAKERKIRRKLKESLKKEKGVIFKGYYNFKFSEFEWATVNLEGEVFYNNETNGYIQKSFFIYDQLMEMVFDFYEKYAKDLSYYKKKSRLKKLKKIYDEK